MVSCAEGQRTHAITAGTNRKPANGMDRAANEAINKKDHIQGFYSKDVVFSVVVPLEDDAQNTVFTVSLICVCLALGFFLCILIELYIKLLLRQ